MRVTIFVFILIAVTGCACASVITELESNGEAINNSLSTAQLIPGAAFTSPAPATVFDPPGWKTATITGYGGQYDGGDGLVQDVDFYSFTAVGGEILLDVDNFPATFDTQLSLWDASGRLLAWGDDSDPVDPGSENTQDGFLGIYALPGGGTYYIGVAAVQMDVAAEDWELVTLLTRPDAVFGGYAFPAVNASFSAVGPQGPDDHAYTLHFSLNEFEDNGDVPEPATGLLLGGPLLLLGLLRRR